MINDLISKRRSVFAFSTKPIEQEKINAIFEAAQLAPSSMNVQPWRYVYATQDNKEEFKVLFDCLAETNQRWAQNAYMLVLSVTELSYVHNNKEHVNKYAWHDVGAAMGMLMVQAASLGLVCHPMGGFDAEKARKDLKIQELFAPVAMIAIGYPGNIEELPEDLKIRQQTPRNRKPLSEVVFKGKFGL
jgi:nitroreductase